MDMGSSEDEEEDGQINKFDEEEEQDRKYFSKTPAEDEGPLTVTDLEHVRVSRDALIKHCFSPWFPEFITGTFISTSIPYHRPTVLPGAWVRYLVGSDEGQPVYRVCEVVGLYPLFHRRNTVITFSKMSPRMLSIRIKSATNFWIMSSS